MCDIKDLSSLSFERVFQKEENMGAPVGLGYMEDYLA
jgi:hypothetical protein